MPPEWACKIMDQVNWSKHFGPQWPLCLVEMPDWDCEEFLEQVDFTQLVSVASDLRHGMPCEIVNEHLGHYNLVYDIEFHDGSHMIARVSLFDRQYQCDDPVVTEKVQ